MHKEVFVLIRLIDMVEKCAQLSDDRISPEDHQKQMIRLLERLQSFQEKIPGFEMQKFGILYGMGMIFFLKIYTVQDYNLEDCKFGLDRIKRGAPKIQQTNQIQLVKELMQKFFQLQDMLLTVQENPKVSELKPQIEHLLELLGKAILQLSPYNSCMKELQDLYQNRIIYFFFFEQLQSSDGSEIYNGLVV